uniref:WD repeat domain 11 n=1 Tax=Prolemur simus TaxID=1328070 RepID=A0A8C9DJU6_PROSS
MLLLYPREILILDLEVNQTVGVIAIERTGVPFLQVIPCFQRDGLFCLHENGCITLRVRRSYSSIFTTSNEEPDLDPVQELTYDLRSQCDAIRVTKTVRPFSMVCCPVNENSAALIVSDGRVMIWELKSAFCNRSSRNRTKCNCWGRTSQRLHSAGSAPQIPANRTAFRTALATVCYPYVPTVDHKKHQDVSATACCW